MLCWALKLYPLGFRCGERTNACMSDELCIACDCLTWQEDSTSFRWDQMRHFLLFSENFNLSSFGLQKMFSLCRKFCLRLNLIEHRRWCLQRKCRAFSEKLRVFEKASIKQDFFGWTKSTFFIETFYLQAVQWRSKNNWIARLHRFRLGALHNLAERTILGMLDSKAPRPLKAATQRTGHSSRLVIKRWFINSLIGRILTQFEIFQFSW